jgi:DNA-binding response OmpR family regulator
MSAPLVVLVGEAAKTLRYVDDLIRGGFVVLVAPSLELAREWLSKSPPAKDGAMEHATQRVGDLSIDRAAHQVLVRGSALPLTEQELQFLAVLAEEPGRVLSFAELVNRVWGIPYYGDQGAIRAAAHRLRRKLNVGGAGVQVQAVRGVGFRLEWSSHGQNDPVTISPAGT